MTVATVDLNLWGLARILVIDDDPKTRELPGLVDELVCEGAGGST